MSKEPACIHPAAICESRQVGDGTRVWAWCHVLPGAKVGEDCNLCDHVFIENDVVVGDRVTVKCGVQLWDGVRVEDDVFIGPNATFSNDKFPRSRQRPASYSVTTLRRSCSVGANATISPGITIGEHAMVGAGAVVTRDVPPWAVVTGNPARVVSFANIEPDAGAAAQTSPGGAGAEIKPSRVQGVKRYRFPFVSDPRGNLTVAELQKELPFAVARMFLVFDVPSAHLRGEHAHRTCEQFMLCVKGSCVLLVDDGMRREEFLLNRPDIGVFVPAMVWATQYKHTLDSTLLVLASHEYDPGDYIRDYSDFRKEVDAVPVSGTTPDDAQA